MITPPINSITDISTGLTKDLLPNSTTVLCFLNKTDETKEFLQKYIVSSLEKINQTCSKNKMNDEDHPRLCRKKYRDTINTKCLGISAETDSLLSVKQKPSGNGPSSVKSAQ